jgi:Ion channel
MTWGRQRAGALAASRHSHPVQSPARFGLLLLLLVLNYLISAFLSGVWVSAVQIGLFVMVVTLATRTAQMPPRTVHAAIALLAVGSAAALALAVTRLSDAASGAANLWTALILVFAVVLIVRRVLAAQAVTLQSIYGAVSAYMIIGLMFAALYNAMNKFGAGMFFASHQPGNLKTFQYFSFTTLTTLGYGDFTAAGNGGRAVAMIEAMLGQIFLATLVARLVAAFRSPGRPSAGGPRRGRRYPGAGRPARPPARAAALPAGATRRGTSSRARAWRARRSRSRQGR